MNANLHLHSRFSDGSQWPEEIALAAARQKLEMAAITDHDTLGGTERFLAECARLGIQGITGCELDVDEPKIDYKSEILGYFPDRGASRCTAVSALVRGILAERKKRLEYYLYWSRTIFRREDLVFEDILKDRIGQALPEGSDGVAQLSWSKVDIFLYLKARGLLTIDTTYKKFKREWFGPGRFPKYKLDKPSVRDAVRAIHADGGFAVIPHFGHLWNDDVDEMRRDETRLLAKLAHFRSLGVDGVELYWYSGKKRTEEINGYVRSVAEPMGFFFTFGSDCHGPGTDKCTIDKFSGDFGGFENRVPLLRTTII
jgi:hypothetical protein